MDHLTIDCTTCPVREQHCDDCMVTALLAPRAAEVPLDPAERRAVSLFVSAGLVTPEHAATLVARREPWDGRRRDVG